MSDSSRNPLHEILRGIASVVIGVYVVLDAIIEPLYGPFKRWLAGLTLVRRLTIFVEGLPPYAILVTLAVPFAIAEPLKLYAILLMGSGRFKLGLFILILAYAASIALVDRIFEAGRGKLLTIRWFARAYALVVEVRKAVADAVKASPAWRAARGCVLRVRSIVSDWRRKFA